LRLVTIGCEYVGKTALADALQTWGAQHGRNFHMDDSDFSIPDDRHLAEDEQQALVEAPPALKERFQRMQIYYHVFVQRNCEDCIFGGYHIQEAIYGPRYYYPGTEVHYQRQVEGFLQPDTILVLMTADPDEIRARMKAAPHKFPIVPPGDVEEVQAEFEKEFAASTIKRKVHLDTTGFPADEILDRFLVAVRPALSARDLLLMS
jgi:hypothetical protein